MADSLAFHQIHFSGRPALDHAIVGSYEQAAFVVDSGGDPLLARIASNPTAAQDVGGGEALAKYAEASGDDDVQIVIDRLEHVRKQHTAVGRRATRDDDPHGGRAIRQVVRK
jgi:hypothetical protein